MACPWGRRLATPAVPLEVPLECDKVELLMVTIHRTVTRRKTKTITPSTKINQLNKQPPWSVMGKKGGGGCPLLPRPEMQLSKKTLDGAKASMVKALKICMGL